MVVAVKPVFPAEIEHVIFTLAAQLFPGSIPNLMLVAFRIHEW
jgi:hypothetical protein